MGRTDAEKAASAARKKERDDARNKIWSAPETRILSSFDAQSSNTDLALLAKARECDTPSSDDGAELDSYQREARALTSQGTFSVKKTGQAVTPSDSTSNAPSPSSK